MCSGVTPGLGSMEKVSKRLYVGGLGYMISKAELEEKFGKFGRVLETEIITRKDDQGNSFLSSFKNSLLFWLEREMEFLL